MRQAAKDLTGMRFGLLTVKRQADLSSRQKWVVQCSCGSPEKVVVGWNLLRGGTRSCGCATMRFKQAKRDKKTSLVNRRFGRLLVLWKTDPLPRKDGMGVRTRWECKCDCGHLVKVLRDSLLGGTTQSCGCLKREVRMMPPGHAGFTALFNKYQKVAFSRGLEWLLSQEQFRDIVTKPCHYCGRQPSQISVKQSENGAFLYNGIDRLNNAGGYVLGNVVPCCGTHNRMKGTMSHEEFITHCAEVTKHLNRTAVGAKA